MTQNVWKCVIAVSLFSACTLASVPLFGQGGVTQPVQVVNTPNVNVVNTPSVSVSNTPSVNVANTPTVTLEAGAGVSVTSPLDGEGNPAPLAVLDAVQPYEDFCQVDFSGSDLASCNFQAIPSGKRLVIQEFDLNGIMETGLKPAIVGLIPSTIPHVFTATFMGSFPDGFDEFATHQETRLYVPASSAPQCLIRATSTSYGSFNCQLSGFLVDVPLGGSGDVQPHRAPSLPNGHNPLLGRQPNNRGR